MKGSCVEEWLNPAEMRTCEADALVDTGAVRTVLPPATAGAGA
jgi:hypothetical protein